MALLATGALLVALGPAAGAAASHPVLLTTGSGPKSQYDCKLTTAVAADAFTGADGTASEIGWEGNQGGVITCLGGVFVVQDGIFKDFGFGIYNGSPTTWTDADGYLPAQTTSFGYSGARVSITEFADRLVIGGDAYVAVYSRVAVSNPTDHVVAADPGASAGLVPLGTAPDAVAPHATVDHDYVVAADRFGGAYPWPSAAALASAGSFDQHFEHMRSFWNGQLSAIAGISVPDRSLEDAYRSGFIYTQIARSGNQLHSGVSGYEAEFSHDVIGILSNLFNQGYFTDAHALLLEARNVMGSQGQYDDGVWTYSVPWAIYLMKTGDLAFVKENFDSQGPLGAAQPSIEDTAHAIASGRTGPSGVMGATNDIDTEGYWTTDDYSALLGLAAYRYLAQQVGDVGQATWAAQQYDSLLSATNTTLKATIHRYHLDYLPCSILQPNTANRCRNPKDANWVSPLGSWAWEGSLLGAPLSGPGTSMIDGTYDYGFSRLEGKLPPNTFGGFPGDYYSSAYNAGDGTAGLTSQHHRDQGILGYEFMIANSQSGPYSWWESSSAPSTHTPWIGRHPASGQGASPHAWGMSTANKVLLDSIVAQRADGSLVVGRGIPAQWLGGGRPISVTNFPTTDGRRLSLRISSNGRSVSLNLGGEPPLGRILFQLPSFVDNIATTTSGSIDQGTGTVTLSPRTRTVDVRLRSAP
ncbi:MAG: carbohydrate-binding protein [Acidimicrobiales bacterium]